MQIIKNILKVFIVWLVILVACFAVLEIAFRFLRQEGTPLMQVVQKDAGTLFKPGASFHSVSSVPGEFDYTARINNFGYRGNDFLMPKPAGTVRILAVGDSFTFGVGSPEGETIPARLGQVLRAGSLPVEVVNAGIGGQSPVAHYVNIRDIHLRYRPDIVVLLFDLTDLWDDWYYERQAVRDKNGEIVRFDPLSVNGRRDWWKVMAHYSVFCRYFNNKVVRTVQKMQALGVGGYLKSVKEGKRAKAVIATSSAQKAQDSSIEYDGVLFMRGREKGALIRAHWPRTEKYILKIRDMLAARGIPLVIVMYPHGIYVDGDQWRDGRKTWGFEPGRRYTDHFAFELMAEFAQREKVPFINTLEAFLKAPRDKYFFDWDGHMTPRGNIIVADVLAKDASLLQLIKDAAAK